MDRNSGEVRYSGAEGAIYASIESLRQKDREHANLLRYRKNLTG